MRVGGKHISAFFQQGCGCASVIHFSAIREGRTTGRCAKNAAKKPGGGTVCREHQPYCNKGGKDDSWWVTMGEVWVEGEKRGGACYPHSKNRLGGGFKI